MNLGDRSAYKGAQMLALESLRALCDVLNNQSQHLTTMIESVN